MTKKDDYTPKDVPCIIPGWLKKDSSVSAYAKMLYGTILCLSNKKGYCWASNTTLGKELGMSPSTVKRKIRELEEKGLVHSKHKNKGTGGQFRHIYLGPSRDSEECDFPPPLKQSNNSYPGLSDPGLLDPLIKQEGTDEKALKSKKSDRDVGALSAYQSFMLDALDGGASSKLSPSASEEEGSSRLASVSDKAFVAREVGWVEGEIQSLRRKKVEMEMKLSRLERLIEGEKSL